MIKKCGRVMVKCIFPYTHSSKTQEFNRKMNVTYVQGNVNN